LNPDGVKWTEAVACRGEGVKETLKLISALVMEKVSLKCRPEEPVARPPSVAAPTLRAAPVAGEGAAKSNDRAAAPVAPLPAPAPVAARPAASAKPSRLAIRQRCDVFWRGMRIGTASLELTDRINVDGRGEYQLAENSRLLRVFSRIALRMLDYGGEGVQTMDSGNVGVYVFHESARSTSNGAGVDVWVYRSEEQWLYARRKALGGNVVYAPAGSGGAALPDWTKALSA
ncbi:MAG: hypothetical protein NTW86_27825, partial [Candidatus Sumerlaeota bacterium]|nr:hypothetical protein [Candidatus Sumerlaeota bacterium]